ncbi:hypothetical protein CMI37_21025 [Candidatus Pacearchaeota archaeon]|nr:hypothetical protein [Candidatus Pacearchaeota archaeon]|tara:strand:- start:2741 stop:3208 length:468 start_codon:yes stop_codon:yes gene_type:complete
MRHYRLTNQERAATGYTDAYALDHKDLTDADGSQNIVLESLPVNTTICYTDACMICTEAWGGGDATEVKVQVGHGELNNNNTADPNYFIADTSVLLVNKFVGPVTAAVSAITITDTTPLDCTWTVTGDDCADLTTGGLVIYFKIIRQTDVLGAQG